MLQVSQWHHMLHVDVLGGVEKRQLCVARACVRVRFLGLGDGTTTPTKQQTAEQMDLQGGMGHAERQKARK
jgi:hypothetical protein